MEQYLPFAVGVAKYLGAVGVTLIALKASWEMSQGKGLKSLIINFLGFLAIFGCAVVFMPKLFNWGLDKVYAQIETSPHVANVEKIVETGYNLISTVGSDSASSAAITIPEVPASAPASSETQGVSFSAPTTSNEVAPAAPVNNAVAPVNNAAPSGANSFTPSYHEIVPDAPAAKPMYSGNIPGSEALKLQNTSNPNLAGPGYSVEQAKQDADGGGGPESYTVKSGDSLAKIARRFDISVNALCQANTGVVRNCNVIRTGWVLAIP